MPAQEFTVDNFEFASADISIPQDGLIRDFAKTILFGLNPIPPISGVSSVVVTGHAKGTANLEKHANRRRDSVRDRLKNHLAAFGAANSDIAKVVDGAPVTVSVGSDSGVTGKDRKVTIRIAWKAESLIRTVGAWCGSATLSNPKRDVDFAVENNINRLDIVINDHSAKRMETPFSVRDSSKIAALCKRAQDNGIETHLMSWIMPHRSYIEKAAELLVPLCEDVGAASLQWDAEEPWVLAKKGMGFPEAASLLAEKFSDLSCGMGVTAIGFASVTKVGPLIAVCDYGVPQAYSTTKSGVKPGSGQKMLHKRWSDNFGKPIVMGLAAFRQSGIPGHTMESAMKACVQASADLDCTAVIYWSLQHIRSSATVRKVIADIRA